MLKESIRECNVYGNFLRSNFIITNVKELSEEEIDHYLKNQQQISEDSPDL
jgi:hypothetical protein